MPIYAYRCKECGFAKDVLQKVSEAPLTDCPSCEKSTFEKQLTAAGFQLKGSGWYATDFKNGSGKKADTTVTSTAPVSSESAGGAASSDTSGGAAAVKDTATSAQSSTSPPASSDPK